MKFKRLIAIILLAGMLAVTLGACRTPGKLPLIPPHPRHVPGPPPLP